MRLFRTQSRIRFRQYAKASGRANGRVLFAGFRRIGARPRAALLFPGRVVRRRRLGWARPVAFDPVVEAEGQVVLINDLPSGSTGSRHDAGVSSVVMARPRRCLGFALGRRSHRDRGSVENRQAFRWAGSPVRGGPIVLAAAPVAIYKVRPGAPSAGTPRRFLVQEPRKLRRRRERPSSGARMR